MQSIKRILSNKIIIYLLSRYGTYAIQFIVSIAIASKLGPYYLGVYGFVTLLLSYFNQVNLGIPHSLNVLLVHHKHDNQRCFVYIANSLIIYFFVSLFVLLCYGIISLFDYKLSDEYGIDKYLCLITIVGLLSYYNLVMCSLLRVKNKINQLSIVQSLNVVLNLVVIPFFDKEQLVLALIICQLITYIVTIIITKQAQILPKLKYYHINWDCQKEIINKGLYLFLYNSCFYFILISVRTVISTNYEVEEFGAFTFSFTIAHAVLLLIESLMSVIFPKIIDLLSSDDHNKISDTLESIRAGFISSSHFLIYVAMLFFPVLVIMLPKYTNALTSMNLIALAILMNTNSYGYSTLLIAKNKEKTAALISFWALILNIALAVFLSNILKVSFSYVILATLASYLFFSFLIVMKGKEAIGVYKIHETLINFFPLRLVIPYIAALFISLLNIIYLIWVPIFLYLLFNMSDIKMMLCMAQKLVHNPNISDI